jgi:GWxTD domain-containing protein
MLEQNSGSIARDYKEHKTTVNDFLLTTSQSAYIQGFIKFSLEAGKYIIKPVYSDLNSNREFRSNPAAFSTDSLNNLIGNPIVIKSDKHLCNGDHLICLANSSSSIPFSSESYSLLIPIFNDSIDKITIRMTNENSKEFNYTKEVDEFVLLPFTLTECDDNIVLSNKVTSESNEIKLFTLKDISNDLLEGLYSLKVELSGEEKTEQTFKIPVRWINKPRSLYEPEKSFDYLDLIENSDVVSELRNIRKEDLTHRLFDFWKKYDPTPETKFNELMAEFYYRIDYSELNFRALANNNGARSDRGKIYVQYGSPESIDRFTDEYGRMLEQWKYVNPSRIFTFIDKKGTGNFTLLSTQ